MDVYPDPKEIRKPIQIEQISGPERKPHDILEFESMLRYEDRQIFGEFGFEKTGTIFVTRAPGRLDVMGGSADFCGANVLETTIERAAVAACQARKDWILKALTYDTEGNDNPSGFQISLNDFYTNGTLNSYSQVRQLFAKNPRTSCTGYVLCSFYVLLKEKKVDAFPHGAVVVIRSKIPTGVGMGSSFAIKVAALSAISHLYGLNLNVREIARIGEIIENQIVGAPRSITVGIVAAAGQQDKILSILCQPDRVLETVSIPPNTKLIGINSKSRRRESSSAYIDARTAAFMGLTILQKELKLEELRDNYLCRLSVENFREKGWKTLPAEMKGEDFLNRYGDTADALTLVDAKENYRIRSRVEHPIYEHARVQKFIGHLKNASENPAKRRTSLIRAGKLMYASNWSYRFRMGLGSPQVEQIVQSARRIGIRGGLYGAKITGGGGGGTVALLCHGDVSNALVQILAAYKLAWGLEAEVFTGSSPGASEFGHIVLKLI